MWLPATMKEVALEPLQGLVLADVTSGHCGRPAGKPQSLVTSQWGHVISSGDCSAGVSGHLRLPFEALESFHLAARSCLALCVMCTNCRSVSFSPQRGQCRWYQNSTCERTKFVALDAYVSGRVDLAWHTDFVHEDGPAVYARTLATSKLREMPLPCGYHRECARNYSLAYVNASAAAAGEGVGFDSAEYQHRRRDAASACRLRGVATLPSGGWCIKGSPERGVLVSLPHNQSYRYPAADGHIFADQGLVGALLSLPSMHAHRPVSISDFGAGVGQYGHGLLSRHPHMQWRGYDGAGNVEEYTSGFVRWFDLSIALALPRTDWVVSMEVGEHISARGEGMYIRNLHAHNCRGIILSWAKLNQWGKDHVNNHRRSTLVQTVKPPRIRTSSTAYLGGMGYSTARAGARAIALFNRHELHSYRC